MPKSVNQVYDLSGLVSEEAVPWDVDSFREELAAERWRRETAGITVGPYQISTMRDSDRGIESQKFSWGNYVAEMRARPAAPGMTIKNPETGVPVWYSREHVLRIGDCIAWYIGICFDVEGWLYNEAANADLDALELVMRSTEPNNPWPQRVFDL